jgi:hypothetical protein
LLGRSRTFALRLRSSSIPAIAWSWRFASAGECGGGVELEQIFGILYTLRDGKVVSMQWSTLPRRHSPQLRPRPSG